MRIKEEIQVKLQNKTAAKAIYDAIHTEMASPPINDRSRITNVHLEGSRVIIEIEADDLTALRASTDSKLRWISAMGDSLAIIGNVR